MEQVELKKSKSGLLFVPFDSDIKEWTESNNIPANVTAGIIDKIQKDIEKQIMDSFGVPNRMIHEDVKLSVPVYFGDKHTSIYSIFHKELGFDTSFVTDSNNTTIELAVKHFFERIKGLTFPFVLERKNPAKQSSLPYYCPWSNSIKEMDAIPVDEITFSFSVYDYSIRFPTKQFPLLIQFKIAINNNPSDKSTRINDLERLFISSNYYMVLSGEMDIEDPCLINSIRINRLLMVNPHSSASPRVIINSADDHEQILKRVKMEEQLKRGNIL